MITKDEVHLAAIIYMLTMEGRYRAGDLSARFIEGFSSLPEVERQVWIYVAERLISMESMYGS